MGEDDRLAHQPLPDTDPLHDLGSVGTISPDVYEHPDWYGYGEPAQLRAIHRVLLSVRHRPDALVTIYRAVPEGVSVIRTGDWVSVTEGWARTHAIQNNDPGDDWPVLFARVPARTVRTGGGDIVEWGYWGPPLEAAVTPNV